MNIANEILCVKAHKETDNEGKNIFWNGDIEVEKVSKPSSANDKKCIERYRCLTFNSISTLTDSTSYSPPPLSDSGEHCVSHIRGKICAILVFPNQENFQDHKQSSK
ncbi:unnamed protein product [Auanema sp. JU1783]|nr:unnamed protein product [Auanema sp. JU1783]